MASNHGPRTADDDEVAEILKSMEDGASRSPISAAAAAAAPSQSFADLESQFDASESVETNDSGNCVL